MATRVAVGLDLVGLPVRAPGAAALAVGGAVRADPPGAPDAWDAPGAPGIPSPLVAGAVVGAGAAPRCGSSNARGRSTATAAAASSTAAAATVRPRRRGAVGLACGATRVAGGTPAGAVASSSGAAVLAR